MAELKKTNRTIYLLFSVIYKFVVRRIYIFFFENDDDINDDDVDGDKHCCYTLVMIILKCTMVMCTRHKQS